VLAGFLTFLVVSLFAEASSREIRICLKASAGLNEKCEIEEKAAADCLGNKTPQGRSIFARAVALSLNFPEYLAMSILCRRPRFSF